MRDAHAYFYCALLVRLENEILLCHGHVGPLQLQEQDLWVSSLKAKKIATGLVLAPVIDPTYHSKAKNETAGLGTDVSREEVDVLRL